VEVDRSLGLSTAGHCSDNASHHTILSKLYRPIKSEEAKYFTIDVVTRKYFPKLLKIINKDKHDFINSLLQNNKRKLNNILQDFKFDARKNKLSAYSRV